MLIFFVVWHWFWSFFGGSVNILLVYVAVFKSPKAIRSYATLIINFGVTDVVECFLDWFLQIRLMPVSRGLAIVYILDGLCKYFGEKACAIGTGLLVHCLPHSVWSLLLSFGYRYYILHNEAFSRKRLTAIVVLVYLPSLFQALTYWSAFVPQSEIFPLAEKWFPQYNLSAENGVITGIVDVTNWAAAYGVAHICLPIFPVYVTIIILRKRIIYHLEANKTMMAKETKASHSQLLKALTLQAIIPSFMSMAVLCYLLGQTGLVVSPILEHSTYGFVIMMPALSPLTYLLYVRPYRIFLKRQLTIRKLVYPDNFNSNIVIVSKIENSVQ